MANATIYCPGHGFIGNGRACPYCEREREIVALRAKSPKRANPGAAPAPQADAGHLPLFIAANEPRLI